MQIKYDMQYIATNRILHLELESLSLWRLQAVQVSHHLSEIVMRRLCERGQAVSAAADRIRSGRTGHHMRQPDGHLPNFYLH